MGTRGNPALQRVRRADQLALRAADFFVVDFLAVFFAAAFLAGAFFAVFLAGDFFAAGFSSADDSPRADLAASTDRWSAASRSTTSPEDFVEVGVRLTSPPSILDLTSASTASA